ncbi:unnamed protein product [Cylicocyclus nassatus]|uniref:Uncharacterized protein n=1 Tax=Cylicocyclus nassatus TaxID=53992 RepID=A0AA36GLR9_CYLNA|nr:unnamed protein product [Cylicocyclus nassatus]
MIENNEKSMRRRHLDFVRIERIGQGRVQLSMKCDEEGKKMKWIACQKRRRRDPLELSIQIKKAFVDFYRIAATGARVDVPNFMEQQTQPAERGSSTELPTILVDRLREVFRGSEVDRLRLNEMELSDEALHQIGSCLRSTNCRVRLLSLELTSLSSVSPSALLQFVRDVAPTDLVFRMLRGCTEQHFGPEMCRFIVSRRFFSVSELIDAQGNDILLSLDDSLLSELSASTFQIAVPSSITVDGLRSFLKAFASGKRSLENASIKTSFPLRERFPPTANAKIFIEDEKTINIYSQAALQAVC